MNPKQLRDTPSASRYQRPYGRTPREQVLTEWRVLPCPDPEPDRIQNVGDILSKIVGKLGLNERLREQEVLAAWHGMVGDFIAIHSAPFKLRNGVLMVRVLQPSVRYELDRVWKADILKKLKDRFGNKIRGVEFVIS